MKVGSGSVLGSVARVLSFGAVAAACLGAVVFLFSLFAHGFDWLAGLDWSRKVVLVIGALMLISGGCGIFVSGRDRPDATLTPNEDDTFRMFWHEVGMPWGAAVCVASVSFLAVGTLVDLLFFSLT